MAWSDPVADGLKPSGYGCLIGGTRQDHSIRLHDSFIQDIKVIMTYAIPPSSSGHHSDHTGNTAGTVGDLQIVRPDKRRLTARLFAFHQGVLHHDVAVAHLSSK